ncbi:MAG TPA: hypothetical protein VJB68_01260, partial [Methylophilaceae bacterium]|nr:hypothetical protein [Methylophilaceae bacterium]
MAREVGRVIGGHHDANTGTSILLSVLATVLFPAAGILQGLNSSAALANATSSATVASAAASTAVSSATSFLGSKMVLAGIKPKQLREADAIAMRLLKPLGWSENDIASSLESCTHIDGEDAWAKDFRFSAEHVRTLVPEEGTALASAAPLVTRTAQNNLGQAPAASGLVAIESKSQVKVQAQNQVKIQDSALALKSEPSQDTSEVSKPALVVAEQVPETTKVAETTPQATADQVTAAKDTEIIAKNEVISVSPDITAKGDATMPEANVPEANLEGQEAPIEDGASDILTEEFQLSDAVSQHVTKMSVRSAMAKKITPRAKLNKNGSKVVSKKASKKASKVASKKASKVASKK